MFSYKTRGTCSTAIDLEINQTSESFVIYTGSGERGDKGGCCTAENRSGFH